MEDKIVVRGRTSVNGTLPVHGAKNSVLKLMAATLLAEGRSTITNVPEIQDVSIMAELLRRLGCQVDYDRAGHTVAIDVPEALHHQADYDLVRAMRASISVLGPLTVRSGAAEVAVPGGDAIGTRGLDMHRAGLEAMGAHLRTEGGYLKTSVDGRLHGAHYRLPYPSVGATENLMTAATLADGVTVLDNVAREPEIVDICRMLVDMGAQIEGIGTGTLTITGVERLQPVIHRTVPDRIVAGTWAFAAAITGGEVVVQGAEAEHDDEVAGPRAPGRSPVRGRLPADRRGRNEEGAARAPFHLPSPTGGEPGNAQPMEIGGSSFSSTVSCLRGASTSASPSTTSSSFWLNTRVAMRTRFFGSFSRISRRTVSVSLIFTGRVNFMVWPR